MRTIPKVPIDWYQITLELYFYAFWKTFIFQKYTFYSQVFIKDLNICSDLPVNIINVIKYYIDCALPQTISSLKKYR